MAWGIRVTLKGERDSAWLRLVARDFDGTPTNVILVKDPSRAKLFPTAAECDAYLPEVGQAFALLQREAVSQSTEVDA